LITENVFVDLMERVRANDQDAVAELINQYEPFVRREIRIGMIRTPLRRLVDSLDVTQSVWISFFKRTSAGDYEINSPEQLQALLISMARKKLASQFRRHHRLKRDLSRSIVGAPLDYVVDRQEDPCQQAQYNELLVTLTDKLSHEERQIAELRRDSLTWAEVANRMGGTAQGRRMQINRAVDRLTTELGGAAPS
jgi:RNA polymerase sigma factor (sigma-70 family)